MANDIAAFFDAESGKAAAAERALHISRYWEPRMRREIIAHVQAAGRPDGHGDREKTGGARARGTSLSKEECHGLHANYPYATFST